MTSRARLYLVRDHAGTPACRADWAARLSTREAEVLFWIAQGRSNAEIAAELFIAVATVKTHVARLLDKTGARDRLQLVVEVYRSGYLTPYDEPSPGS